MRFYYYLSTLSLFEIIFIAILLIIAFVMVLFTVVGLWGVFNKAGQSGWKVLIPIYNMVILLRIIEEKSYKVLFFFIPIYNLIFMYQICLKLCHAFGKGKRFAAGLFFLPFVFYLLLGFGDSECLTAKVVETDDYWTYM